MTRMALSILAALFACASPLGADVIDRAANGFTVRTVVTIAQPPERVYETLTKVGGWWDPRHTWSGDSANLRLDARAGGCLCETLPAGGSVEHAVVVYAAPGALLRLRGALGPLQSTGLSGSLTWEMKPAAAGSTVSVTYAVGGYLSGGASALADAVDEVIGGQLRRLKAIIEGAKP